MTRGLVQRLVGVLCVQRPGQRLRKVGDLRPECRVHHRLEGRDQLDAERLRLTLRHPLIDASTRVDQHLELSEPDEHLFRW